MTVSVSVDQNTVSAADDTADTAPVTPVRIPVLANDTSATGQPLGAPTVVAAPAGGTAAVDGQDIVYTPSAGFSGVDTFTYRVCDTSTPTAVCSTDATVSVRVRNAVDAVDDAVHYPAEHRAHRRRAGQRHRQPRWCAAGPRHAAGRGDARARHGHRTSGNEVRYVPATGYSGTDTFRYRVCDTGNPATCDTAVVTMTVGTNTVTAADDTDSDNPRHHRGDQRPGQRLRRAPASRWPTRSSPPAPSAAPPPPSPTASIAYTPRRGFSGTDSFTYRVCDTGSPPACATATVTVATDNQITTRPDTAATAQNTAVTVAVLANDEASGAPLGPRLGPGGRAAVRVDVHREPGRHDHPDPGRELRR